MRRRFALLAAVGLLCCLPCLAAPAHGTPAAAPGPGVAPGPAPSASPATPLMAYYYQWYDPGSWRRAKADLPALGGYSSDDPNVIRRHIREAKAAGIDGFITSWKDTPKNDRRLALLMSIARAEHFRLAMIYQGLDFTRRPLPAERVRADFRTFRDRYAHDPVFLRLGGKPLTILSGTWKFSHQEVARITSDVRGDLLVLASEKNVAGYRRLADVTDGDAYYWSSVDPYTQRGSAAKLRAMADAVHADGHYWVAPFAPGFDARLVGGTGAVPRRDGATLRAEYGAAIRSAPDVLGLISWNEFSENTHVEPSRVFGTRYLRILRELRGGTAPAPAGPAVDSSDGPVAHGAGRIVLLTAGLTGPAALIAGAAVLRHRQRVST
ncbi:MULTISPECIES: endo-1,3-alpha-glucanase family glycosylhydrolase [unclassified Streptomyces]|uniref:endo-1,3-alpha-glucanase family glycosylhydrolase n=1 Tax=unclassified Streptomyces TaxID=2593676 RepID=UPI0036F529F1